MTVDVIEGSISQQQVAQPSVTLQDNVRQHLTDYLKKLGNELPKELYDFVLVQVEKPLLEVALNYVNGNQSKAARILGLSRGTLRKKMKQYDLFK